MDIAELVRTLRDDAELETVREAVSAWGEDVDPAIMESTLHWIRSVRRELADLLELVTDPDDARMMCAVKHMEFKAHWIMLNTRTNYGLMAGRGFDQRDAFRGTALSGLVDQLEGLLPERHVEAFHAVLAEPLERKVCRVVDRELDARDETVLEARGAAVRAADAVAAAEAALAEAARVTELARRAAEMAMKAAEDEATAAAPAAAAPPADDRSDHAAAADAADAGDAEPGSAGGRAEAA